MTRAAILVLVAIAGALAVPPRITNRMPDFEVYWTAAARAADAEPLYRASDGHYQFKYLPAFAIVLRPLAALPLPTAKRVWFGLSVALLIALIALSLHLLPGPAEAGHYERRVDAPRWAIVLATIATLAKFYGHELVLGQTNVLFAILAVAGLACLRRGDGVKSGLAFGASIVVKPYGAIFLPYLLIKKRYVAALACVGIATAALMLPALSYGPGDSLDLLTAWWTTVTASTEPNLTNQDNVSIAGMYAKWLGFGRVPSTFALTTNLLIVGVAAAALFRSTRSAFPEYLEIALLLTVIPLLSPQGWDYVLLLSTPAVMLLVDSAPRLDRPMQVLLAITLAVVGLSLYDVMGRDAYARFMAFSGITVCYIVVVGLLTSLRAKHLA